jgi:2-succinyl-5-enolpyruvyl-6-hydroxy-3-cyclohexene-1-carboxylate synthase
MIIHGQDFERSDTSSALHSLSRNNGIVVIAENITNTHGDLIVDIPELLLAHCESTELVNPDLVIYSGGQIVSKKLKTYIRSIEDVECWRIGIDENVIDTFQKSNAVIALHHSKVYKLLSEITSEKRDDRFQKAWLDAKKLAENKRMKIVQAVPFSDLKVFDLILKELPAGANLELGNSSVIRYSQVFSARKEIMYYANRGVSGIDGCLSAASGTAFASDLQTIAILGDLSFVYDSNALWNRELSSKLRIIVINNDGGDIFNLIDGPSESHCFAKFFKAHHPVQIQKLAEAYNLGYFCIKDEVQLKSLLPDFYKESNKPLLMEVKTNSECNKTAFELIMDKTPSFDNPE